MSWLRIGDKLINLSNVMEIEVKQDESICQLLIGFSDYSISFPINEPKDIVYKALEKVLELTKDRTLMDLNDIINLIKTMQKTKTINVDAEKLKQFMKSNDLDLKDIL